MTNKKKKKRDVGIILRAVVLAHEDAEKKGLKKGHGGVSIMDCPAKCGGKLHYSVASVNGHMHAICTTKGCLKWME